ncbi:MAG: NB-ARC domain-containing protein [Pseudanabaenaceae cyanobacterium]
MAADPVDTLFPEVAGEWDLNRLYDDLEAAGGKPLKAIEKACLRGLLSRYRPGQIAYLLSWTSGALRVELNKGLYRSIEALAGQPGNTLRWEKVGNWLEAKGYRRSRSPDPDEAAVDWGEAPAAGAFFGRDRERSQLGQWLRDPSCRLLALWGQGGIGKTALAVHLVEQHSGAFASVVWRSLRHVQTVPQLFRELAGESIDPLAWFRAKRRLLVLDDFETVLQEGELAGVYRQGLEGYGTLLTRVARERHQSCLWTIGREQPKEVALEAGEDQAVRSWRLGGLDAAGGRDLLRQRGFTGQEAGLTELIQQYRGNPSALKMVAVTIRDLFDGNVVAFLKQTTLGLGDILQNLLYSQFERLSPLEKDLLFWLALRRRPASLRQLREVLIQPGADILGAMESLHRRALVEKVPLTDTVHFQLEPVIGKYVNRKLLEEWGQEVEQLVRCGQLPECPRLQSHALVEDRAPEAVQAVQIRLTLKPLKDRLQAAVQRHGRSPLELIAALQSNRDLGGYTETNLRLLGLVETAPRARQ